MEINLHHFSKISEIYIIVKILEYADLGLDVLYDDTRKKHYMKFNPHHLKFYRVDHFFSQVTYHSFKHAFVLCSVVVTRLSTELIINDKKRIVSTQLRENNRDLRVYPYLLL